MPKNEKQQKIFESSGSSLMAFGLIIVAMSIGIWGAVQAYYAQITHIQSSERLQLEQWTSMGQIATISTLLVTVGVFRGLNTSLAVSIFVAVGMLIQFVLQLINLRRFVKFISEEFDGLYLRRNKGLMQGYYLLGTQLCFLLIFMGLVVNNAQPAVKKKN